MVFIKPNGSNTVSAFGDIYFHIFNRVWFSLIPVVFLDISVDQIFFPAKAPDKTTQRRQLDELLNGIDETDLVIVTDTIKGIQKAREAEE